MHRKFRHVLCERAYQWSTMRGGCRFEANHAGDCKPGRTYGAGI
jgi:hypothetical protein